MIEATQLHHGCFFNPFQRGDAKNVLRQSHSLLPPWQPGWKCIDRWFHIGCLGFPIMVKWKSGKLEQSCSRKPLRLCNADVPSNELYRQFFCCLFTEANLVELKEVGITSPWKKKTQAVVHNTKEVVSQCYYHCLLTHQAKLRIEWKTSGWLHHTH